MDAIDVKVDKAIIEKYHKELKKLIDNKPDNIFTIGLLVYPKEYEIIGENDEHVEGVMIQFFNEGYNFKIFKKDSIEETDERTY